MDMTDEDVARFASVDTEDLKQRRRFFEVSLDRGAYYAIAPVMRTALAIINAELLRRE